MNIESKLKKVFEKAINKLSKSDLELVFGPCSYVVVEDFSYSTSSKVYNCNVTLYVSKIDDDSLCLFPDALNLFIMDTYKFFAISDKLLINSSIKEINHVTPN